MGWNEKCKWNEEQLIKTLKIQHQGSWTRWEKESWWAPKKKSIPITTRSDRACNEESSERYSTCPWRGSRRSSSPTHTTDNLDHFRKHHKSSHAPETSARELWTILLIGLIKQINFRVSHAIIRVMSRDWSSARHGRGEKKLKLDFNLTEIARP